MIIIIISTSTEKGGREWSEGQETESLTKFD
jgi:hypothetical protein